MSRSQFILGIALLVVSATLAFTISFKSKDNPHPSAVSTKENESSSSSRVRKSPPGPSYSSSNRQDRTFYEVTVSDRALLSVASVVEEESLEKLESLTDQYNLTTSQRRGIFPLIAARHPDFQEGLVINGSVIPTGASASSLADAIYPLLDEEQQEDLEDDMLAKNEWWGEIVRQLREDLDEAISTGEMVPEISAPSPVNTGTPAPGDGETVENPDIDPTNLFNTKKDDETE